MNTFRKNKQHYCVESRATSGRLHTWMKLLAVVAGCATAMSNSVAGVVTEPDNGWTMEEVRLRFGEPGTVNGPVGTPAVTRWDYVDFSVYFENQLVIVAVNGDVNSSSNYVLNDAVEADTSQTTQEVMVSEAPSTQSVAPQSDLVKAAGNFANSAPARAVPVAYTPEPTRQLPSASTVDAPRNGMTMSAVTSNYGSPLEVGATVGNPPITVWHYAGFSVYFEHEIVLMSATDDGSIPRAQPGIIVDSAEQPQEGVGATDQ